MDKGRTPIRVALGGTGEAPAAHDPATRVDEGLTMRAVYVGRRGNIGTIDEPVMRAVSIPRPVSYALRDMPPREMPGWVLKRIGRMMARPVIDAAPDTPPADATPAAAGTARPAVQAPMIRHAKRLGALRDARQAAKAVPFPPLEHLPDPQHPIRGCGVYLRM